MVIRIIRFDPPRPSNSPRPAGNQPAASSNHSPAGNQSPANNSTPTNNRPPPASNHPSGTANNSAANTVRHNAPNRQTGNNASNPPPPAPAFSDRQNAVQALRPNAPYHPAVNSASNPPPPRPPVPSDRQIAVQAVSVPMVHVEPPEGQQNAPPRRWPQVKAVTPGYGFKTKKFEEKVLQPTFLINSDIVREERPVLRPVGKPPTPQQMSETVLSSLDTIAGSMDCAICISRMQQPVSLKCGHSFCRDCAVQALKVRLQCPLCNAEVSSQLPSSNVILDQALRQLDTARRTTRKLVRLLADFDKENCTHEDHRHPAGAAAESKDARPTGTTVDVAVQVAGAGDVEEQPTGPAREITGISGNTAAELSEAARGDVGPVVQMGSRVEMAEVQSEALGEIEPGLGIGGEAGDFSGAARGDVGGAVQTAGEVEVAAVQPKALGEVEPAPEIDGIGHDEDHAEKKEEHVLVVEGVSRAEEVKVEVVHDAAEGGVAEKAAALPMAFVLVPRESVVANAEVIAAGLLAIFYGAKAGVLPKGFSTAESLHVL